MSDLRRRTGAAGEEIARKYLQGLGYRILQMNYHCRYGEIDILAREGPLLVFVEVRTRTGTKFGKAVESITAAKRARLGRLVRYYLMKEIGREVACRVDLVAIDLGEEQCPPEINHLKGIIL